MKLVKLSLAAVVAAGSFSFANAVALDEAIQNVDLSGYLQYRYDSETTKEFDGTRDRSKAQAHKYKAHLEFTADIADNFKAIAVIRYNETNEGSYVAHNDKGEVANKSNADVETGFAVRDAYLSYNNFDTTIEFGRMTMDSFWTDDLIANGVRVLNNSVEGLTLAAYMFDNYNKDGDLAKPFKAIGSDGKTITGVAANNLYGVAALAEFDPVSAELWVAYMNKVATFYAVDLGFNGGDEDFGYSIHAQYAGNSLKGDFKKATKDVVANGNFYGIEAGVNVAGFDANLGYVTFGKKDKWTLNSIEDNGQLISAGEIVINGIYNGTLDDTKSDPDTGKVDAIFATLGYTYDAVRFGVDVVNGKVKNTSEKIKFFEVTPRISYKYSDKLTFSSFYAYAKAKEDGDKGTIKKIRLEAKYSF